MDKTHEEFMEEVKDASSLPAQTCRALSPESQEDIAMYADDSQQHRESHKRLNTSCSVGDGAKRGAITNGEMDSSPAIIAHSPVDTKIKDVEKLKTTESMSAGDALEKESE